MDRNSKKSLAAFAAQVNASFAKFNEIWRTAEEAGKSDEEIAEIIRSKEAEIHGQPVGHHLELK